MGDKSGRIRKYILYYLAAGCITAALTTISCAPVQEKIADMRAHQQLEQYRENLAAGFFETVIQESKEVLRNNEETPPADTAFYALGEVYAHHDYAGRDYSLSKYYFMKLIRNFPDSELVPEAKTYVSLIDTIAAKEVEASAMEKNTVPEVQQEVKEKKKETVPVTPPHKIVEGKNFEEAVQKNLQILEEVGRKKPADEALYNLGLIYAHVDNPAKDYNKSQIYFHLLSKQFPDSEYAEEARIWLGLFETIEKIQQIDVDIEKQKKELTR